MLTVLCPDTPLETPDDRRWPASLRARLSRARLIERHLDTQPIPTLAPLEAWLSKRFGVVPDGLISVAAYRRYAADTGVLQASGSPSSEGSTLTALPSYFQAGMDHLVLHTGDALAITRAEAEQLTDAANDFLADDGIRLSVVTNDCWLLHLSTSLDLQLRSSIQAARRNVHAYMPAGPDGRRLRALLNELQMLWHEHPVNQTRETEGRPPINTLWIEGAVAPLPANRPPSFARLVSADPVLLGLARAAGVDAPSLSEQPEPEPPDSKQAESQPSRHTVQTALQWAAEPAATLLHQPGADNLQWLEELLTQCRLPVTIVLTGEREWIELRSSPRDKLAFWRRTALGSTRPDQAEPQRP